MKFKTDLKAQRAEALTCARAIIDAALAQDRDLTEAEDLACKSAHEQIKLLDRQLEGRKMVESVIGLASSEDFDHDGHPRRGVFTDADTTGLVTALKSRSNFRTEVPSKALIGAVGLLPPTGNGIVGGLHPGAVYPLAALFSNQPATGPLIRYYTMDGAVAGIVGEGQVKGDAGLQVLGKDAAVIKIAVVSTVSDELSDDAPGMVQAIGLELQAAVVTAENSHVVDSWTTSGILTNTATAATLIDVIATEIGVQTATTGVVPSAVVVAPSVLASLQQQRAIANGSYLFDPLSSSPASIHGVAIIATASTPVDTAWVIGSRAATMFRRNGITVEVGLSADDWVRNQTHLRAEERVILAVQRPQMISKITISA